jgi:hypothetical protein
MRAGSAHAMFDVAVEPFEMAEPSHVQVAGQSLSAVQTIESATQLDVVSVVVVQPLVGAEPPSTASSGGDVMTPASSAGSAGGLVVTGGDATPVVPPEPDEPALDPTPVPVAPPPLALAQQAVDVSGTQVKWSPQSALTLHGNSYLGMQALGSVTVVHVGGVGGGHATGETPPSASAGPLAQASPDEEHSL